MAKRLQEEMNELSEKRHKTESRYKKATEEGWTPLDDKNYVYRYHEMPAELAHPISIFRHTTQSPVSLVEIFLNFLDAGDGGLVQKVLEGTLERDPAWNYLSSNSKKADLTIKSIYKALAIKIRLFGLQERPKESTHNDRPLREAITAARNYFLDKYPNAKQQSVSRIEKIVSRFLITHEHFDQLSANFQSVLKELGERAAGDEKLLEFLGDAGDLVLCRSKPDQKGLWFFELVIRLKSRRPYLIDAMLQRAHNNQSISMLEVVERWAKICIDKGQPEMVLAFDSHYATNDVRVYLREHRAELRYAASVQPGRFKNLVAAVENSLRDANQQVQRPGTWHGIYCAQHEESFVYVWDEEMDVGKKYCLSNAIVQAPRPTKSKEGKNIRGPYDMYKVCFNLCDAFNRALHDRKWPFKHGGKGRAGEWGQQDNFAFSSVLQNNFNLFNDVRGLGEEYDFKNYCLELADQLFVRAENNNLNP